MRQGVTDYNYQTFDRSQSGGRAAEFTNRLRAGEEAPDFELATPDGELIKLSQYRDKKNVLLEFGSIT